MPYINPDNIPLPSAANFRGICVLVPDYPEYRAALLGSLNYLAQWTAWERDNQQSAVKSADLWKLANETTKLNWLNQCGESDMAFDCEAMKECLIAVAEAISVSVTVNNSCGGVGGGTSPILYCINEAGDINIQPQPLPPTPITPTVPLPPGMTLPPEIGTPGIDDVPEGWETWEEFDADACRAANALVEWQYQALRSLGVFLSEDVFTYTAFIVVLVNIVSYGLTVLFNAALIHKIVEIVGKITWLQIPGALILEKAEEIDTNRQELVCMLYSDRQNVANWQNTLIAWYMERIGGQLATELERNTLEELLAFLLPGPMSLWLLVDAAHYPVPVGVDCATCDGGEFYLMNLPVGSVDPQNLTIVQNGNTVTFNSGGGDRFIHFLREDLNVPEGDTIVGIQQTVIRANNSQFYTGRNTGGTWAYGQVGTIYTFFNEDLAEYPAFLSEFSYATHCVQDREAWGSEEPFIMRAYVGGDCEIVSQWIVKRVE